MDTTITREVCSTCRGTFAYRVSFADKEETVRLCAAEQQVVEVNLRPSPPGNTRGYEIDDLPIVVHYMKGDKTRVIGLTLLEPETLTLARWTAVGLGPVLGETMDRAVAAWLALPFAERVPT